MLNNKIKFIFLYLALICCLVSLNFGRAYALSLDRLKVYFLSGDYKSAISEGEKILAANKLTSESEELYYILGLSYLKDGNLLRASDIFEIILKEFKDSKFKGEATLGLGDTYFLGGNYAKASEYYKELANAAIASKLKAQAYQRLSQCAFKLGSTQEGKDYLEKLNKEYPNNFESKLNNDISAPSDYYTVQVGSFGSPVNANNFCAILTKKGYDAYVQEIDASGKKTYRVRVGKLASRPDAEKLENKLAQEGYPTKIVP